MKNIGKIILTTALIGFGINSFGQNKKDFVPKADSLGQYTILPGGYTMHNNPYNVEALKRWVAFYEGDMKREYLEGSDKSQASADCQGRRFVLEGSYKGSSSKKYFKKVCEIIDKNGGGHLSEDELNLYNIPDNFGKE